MYFSVLRSWFSSLAVLHHKCSIYTMKRKGTKNWHLQTELKSGLGPLFFSCHAMNYKLEIMCLTSLLLQSSQPKSKKLPYIRFKYISALHMRGLTSETSFWMKGTIPAMWWKISTCSSSTPWMVKASSYCFSSMVPI